MASRLVFAFSLGLLGAFIAAALVWMATWQVAPAGTAALVIAPVFALLGLALGGEVPERNKASNGAGFPFWLG